MGLQPVDLDLLPPSDDRVFKLILTAPGAEPMLVDLISSIIGQPVREAAVLNNEIPTGDAEEKAERFDVNCRIDRELPQENWRLRGTFWIWACRLNRSLPRPA